jgi:Na+-translocating ferredoxin:NAD+ oxidoreductase RnfD subunit
MDIIFQFIFLFGSIYFIGIARDSSRAAWVRHVFFVVAGLVMTMAAYGLALEFGLSLSDNVRSDVDYHLSFVRGLAVGLLCAIVISGELAGKKSSKQ